MMDWYRRRDDRRLARMRAKHGYREAFVEMSVGQILFSLALVIPLLAVPTLLRGLLSSTERGSVRLAVLIAGDHRSYLREEWAAVLAGHGGHLGGLSPRRRRALALGFVMAALRMRASDILSAFWRPVDWLLLREERTNALISSAAGGLAVYFAITDGVHTLITADWQSCAGLGGGLYVLARWLRRIRGIELAERRRRVDREP